VIDGAILQWEEDGIYTIPSEKSHEHRKLRQPICEKQVVDSTRKIILFALRSLETRTRLLGHHGIFNKEIHEAGNDPLFKRVPIGCRVLSGDVIERQIIIDPRNRKLYIFVGGICGLLALALKTVINDCRTGSDMLSY
jgi:hypothetical protein